MVDVGRGAPGPPLIPPIRGVSKTGGAGGGEGGSGSLGGLPCRCHVQQCAPTVHEGQGGDGGIHLIISASSNKHHPMSQAQTKAPLAPTFLLRSQKRNHLPTPRSCFSICIRTPLLPYTFSANSHGPRILFTASARHRHTSHTTERRRHDPCRQGQAGPQWA